MFHKIMPSMGKIIFIILSLIWIYFIGNYLMISGWWADRANLSPMELVGGLGGLALPLLIFFLVMTYYERNEFMARQSQKIRGYLNQLIDPNEDNAQYTQELTKALKKQITDFQSVFSGVNNHTKAVRDDLQRWIEGLNKLVKTVDTQTVTAVQKIATHIQQVAQITHQCNQQATQTTTLLAGQADMLEDVSRKTQRVMGSFSKELNQEISEIQDILHAFETARNQIGETTSDSTKMVEMLGNATQDLSDSVLKLESPKQFLKDTREVGNEFQNVSKNLNIQTERLQSVLNQMQGDMNLIAQGLQNHTQALERHLNLREKQSRDFLREATNISKQLQQYSVELAHLFTPKNEEELWAHYYSGDKTVFMRHLRHVISQSRMSKIRTLYREDLMFQTAVNHYMDTFEQMTTEAGETAKDSPLLGVLIGSDVGRLYMVLAQILKGDRT